MNFLYKLMGIGMAMAEEGVAPAATPIPEGGDMGFLGTVVNLVGFLFPLIIMFVLMYFLMIRPEKKRKKKEQEMLAALKRGDRICTIGGIYGTIADIKDDTITLTVGRDNMSMVVTRWAIRSVEDVTIENESEALN